MKLNELRDNAGARKGFKRVGRGIGSGKGKTSGRGIKGQKARKGVAINGFEGGQMPIYRRLPKRGFNNKRFATDYVELNLGRLQKAIDEGKVNLDGTVTVADLVAARVLGRAKDGLSLLGAGELTSALTIEVAKVSARARNVVEAVGGRVIVLGEDAAAAASESDGEQAES